MHTQAHTHKYTYSTPHTTTARRTKPGVEWGRVRVMKSRRMRWAGHVASMGETRWWME